MIILAPISVGEIYDKITILQVKSERMTDPAKLAKVSRELDELQRIAAEKVGIGATLYQGELDRMVGDLRKINAELWDIEDGKRAAEDRKAFDEHFIQLARDVYIKNDRRAAIKLSINNLTGSTIVEVKSHKGASA